MKKIACLFPGIGYTCDKPLLYYSWKLLKGLGWEIVPVQYAGFPSGAKGNQKKMQQCADMALEQAEGLLRDINWDEYADILFIGKSIGTVASTAYAKRHGLKCRQILFTPVEATFRFAGRRSIAFHGTADPWADTEAVEGACRKLDIPIFITEGANHSLETGDVDADLREMRKVMKIVRDYVTAEAEHRIMMATEADTEAVLRLYRDQIGRPFCFWGEDYPGRETIKYDLSRDALFVMKDEDGEIIAAISAEKDEDVDKLGCWNPSLQPGGEYARLAVKPACQNRGLAREMVSHVLGVLKERGFRSVHILVNRDNVTAIRSYAHFGFRVAGECEMYGQHFLCYEKELD